MIRFLHGLRRVIERWKNRRELARIHANQAVFWCRNAADLPAPAQLQMGLQARLLGVLLFSRGLSSRHKARCIAAVQRALPGARVRDTGPYLGFDRIRFQRVLERDEVLARAEELMAAAREFERVATELSHQVAAKVGVTPTQLSLCGRFLPAEIEWQERGVLNPDWTYYFHGFECCFRHRSTGQTLDVVFGYRDEFGVIEAWFFHEFLETTPHHAALSRWLALGCDDVATALKVLAECEFLLEIESSPDWVFSNPKRRGLIVAPDA